MKLEIKNVNKSFSGKHVLHDVSFTVESGKAMGFLGRNGAGKTTTIKMLTCLIPKTSGEAKVAGFDVTKQPDEVRNKIGMVPQLVSLYKDLTVRENVELCADFYNVDQSIKDKKIGSLH